MAFAQVKKCVFDLGFFATVSARTALIWPSVLSWELWAIVLYSHVAVTFLP